MAEPVLTELHLAGLKPFKSGKVREVFDLGDVLLFVATDRLSAFDCVLPTGIPGKGHVLNQLSAWWFNRTGDLAENHFVTTSVDEFPPALRPFREMLRGRSMVVRKAEPLPVECVVRGYLIGSGWKEYQHSGSVCGIPLRPGYRMADRLDTPLFTPSTKAESGHDENITFADVENAIGPETAAQVRDISLALYHDAYGYARERGLIIADTKFEFGRLGGRVVLIDEVLTPDSSRFWPASSYQPGRSPPSFDKQFVRDYLEQLDWDKTPPAPPLPEEIVRKTHEKYVEAFRLLTGRDLDDGRKDTE